MVELVVYHMDVSMDFSLYLEVSSEVSGCQRWSDP
jgi:hypothetical protein